MFLRLSHQPSRRGVIFDIQVPALQLTLPTTLQPPTARHHQASLRNPGSDRFLMCKRKPHEREDEFDILDYENDLYNCLCDSQQCLHRDATMAQSSVQLSTKATFDYDMADGFFSDGELSISPRSKKRRANDSAFNGLATRFGTRFPSFSRKFKLRKGASSTSLRSVALRDGTTTSSRSSSISNSARPTVLDFETQMPPTPARSVYGGRDEPTMAIDIGHANRIPGEREEGFATTPLLPPLMMDASANTRQVNLQSPLQSPSVAEAKDPYASGTMTPIDAITTTPVPSPLLTTKLSTSSFQRLGHLVPSPPLSTRPSVSSFHRPGHLIPSADIPPMVPLSSEPADEWAIKLGHANFTILPEPYLPTTFDISTCRALRTDWDLARCNYTKHLVRTGEHYGATSSTYILTESKWSSIEAQWRKHNDLIISKTVEGGSDVAFATLKHNVFGESNNVMTKIPSLNDLRSEGKFPQLGDGEIVGPMVQVAAVATGLRRTSSRKQRVLRFIADKFPASLTGRT